MGLLVAATTAPFFLFGLLAGVRIDRFAFIQLSLRRAIVPERLQALWVVLSPVLAGACATEAAQAQTGMSF